MSSWIDYYKVGLEQSQRLNPGALDRFYVPRNIDIEKGFLGYTLQQYIAKAKAGERRPTKAYERILSDVPTEANGFLAKFSSLKVRNKLHLGDVPNLFSLIPLAQSANAPIIALKAKDGLVGSQFNQAVTYREIIRTLAVEINARMDW